MDSNFFSRSPWPGRAATALSKARQALPGRSDLAAVGAAIRKLRKSFRAPGRKAGKKASAGPKIDPRLAKAAQHWSRLVAGPRRTHWWESKLVVRHINQRYCGEVVDGTDGGDIALLRKIQTRKFERAISVGCGSAFHELQLIAAGVVGEFVLYELSEKRAAEALAKAKAQGLADRVSIHVSDAFEPPAQPEFDLVYWKDALHHMLDAQAAVNWSKQVLKPGGTFFMNEFVGPTYMQYTERQLDLAESARRALPDEFLVDPHNRTRQVDYRLARATIADMMASDPTECADSSGILPAVRRTFPDVTVIPTGGVVYMLALADILANLDEVKHAGLLRAMMLADDLCIEAGETLYSVAFAQRPE